MRVDSGFAPNIDYGICSLSGCKTGDVEKNSEAGSWVIGIGGNDTMKPDKLIYAMKVEEKLTFKDFKEKYPKKSQYLSKDKAGPFVLVSQNFYYFGNKAINLSDEFKIFIVKYRGSKTKIITEELISKFEKSLSSKYKVSVFGKPNNLEKNKC